MGLITEDVRPWLNKKYPAFDKLSKKTQERLWEAEKRENPFWKEQSASFKKDGKLIGGWNGESPTKEVQ